MHACWFGLAHPSESKLPKILKKDRIVLFMVVLFYSALAVCFYILFHVVQKVVVLVCVNSQLSSRDSQPEQYTPAPESYDKYGK